METIAFSHSGPRPSTWRELGDLPDDSLVDRVRRHDLPAFEALMRRHSRRLFRVTRSVMRDSDQAQNAVQRAYLRVHAGLDTYQPTGRFGAWVTRLALDEALAMRRSAPGSSAAEKAVPIDSASTEQILEAAHARSLLEHAIDSLPENFRIVFMMRAVAGMDVRDTAESLGINSNTVRTRLFRANRRLRAGLANLLQEESAEVFDLSAERCDAVVAGVFDKLRA
jgi:RNA polymerase sigma-70 factor, ECF subfamily